MSNIFSTVSVLNDLFEQMTKKTGLIFWIRSLDFNQQLYVSSNYQNYWGMNCETLYQYPHSWKETLIAADREGIENRLFQRAQAAAESKILSFEDTLLFRIHKPYNKSITYIRDKAFRLTNKEHQTVAIAGISMPVEENLWQAMVEKQEKEQSSIEQGFIHFIQDVLKLFPQPLYNPPAPINSPNKYHVFFEQKTYKLTLREAQCLYYSSHGHSAKQIAKELNLSYRTIEAYLENIKIKLKCRNKLHLLSGIDINDLPVGINDLSIGKIGL